jgi:hypothetical protein
MANPSNGFYHAAGFFPAGNGSIDLNPSGFGDVAVAILYTNNGRTGGADQGAVRGSKGVYVGNGAQHCTTFSVANNNATNVRGSCSLVPNQIGGWYGNTGALNGTIIASSITNGIRLTLTNSDNAPRYFLCVLMSVSAVSESDALISTFTTGGAIVGYKPDVVMALATGTSTGVVDVSKAAGSLGFSCRRDSTGTLVNRSQGCFVPTNDATAPVVASNYKSSTKILCVPNSGSLQRDLTVTSFNVDGFSTSTTTGGNEGLILLTFRMRQRNPIDVSANNQSAGQTLKTNENPEFAVNMSFCSSMGSGTGLDAVRTLDVIGWSLWSNVDENTKGGYERMNMTGSPTVTASAGNTLRYQNRTYDGAGEYRSLDTRTLANGIEWDMANTATVGTQGVMMSIGYPQGVVMGSNEKGVGDISLGNSVVEEVYKGENLVWRQKNSPN